MTPRTSARFTGIAIAVALLAAGGVGYWSGHRQASASDASVASTPVRKPLFYRNPMGLPDTSPTPKKDPMGMDYIPVYADDAPPETPDAAAASTPARPQIRISADKVQTLGVRTAPVQRKVLTLPIRSAGRIELDERHLATFSPRFEGYIERLHVNATGQAVRPGQPLFEVYSPELISAQREYLLAAQALQQASAPDGSPELQRLADASLARLRNWGLTPEQIQALVASGQAQRSLSIHSPMSGVVTEKKAVQGMRFAPGDVLYQVADLSAVWAVADVPEQDIRWVKSGRQATIHLDAYPDKVFSGRITYIAPTLKVETRTVAVRIELANPSGLLKPGMLARIELPGDPSGPGDVLTVPRSAVIDSGTRQIVLVQIGAGRYEPRQVRLGARGDHDIEVQEGVAAGEAVVVAANFLIDAESNLKAALDSFGQAGHAAHGSAGRSATPPAVSGQARPAAAATPVAHQAQGQLEEIDAQAGTVSISHGPIASLHWPAMTMDFKLANNALLKALKPGARIRFEFVERGPGEWVITALQPDDAHAGH